MRSSAIVAPMRRRRPRGGRRPTTTTTTTVATAAYGSSRSSSDSDSTGATRGWPWYWGWNPYATPYSYYGYYPGYGYPYYPYYRYYPALPRSRSWRYYPYNKIVGRPRGYQVNPHGHHAARRGPRRRESERGHRRARASSLTATRRLGGPGVANGSGLGAAMAMRAVVAAWGVRRAMPAAAAATARQHDPRSIGAAIAPVPRRRRPLPAERRGAGTPRPRPRRGPTSSRPVRSRAPAASGCGSRT